MINAQEGTTTETKRLKNKNIMKSVKLLNVKT